MKELFDWNVSEKEYREYPALNFHTLADFHRDPRAFHEGFFNTKEVTPAMEFGTALHCRILEPERFRNEYAVFEPPINERTGAPYGANTNAYKEAREKWSLENKDKIVLTEQDAATIAKLIDAYTFHANARSIMCETIVREQPIRAKVQINPLSDATVEIKGKIDALTTAGLVDLKTTNALDDASGRERFRYAIYDYHYIVQLAFYRMILREIGYLGDLRCWIIAFEKQEPNRVAVYSFDNAVIDAAEITARIWLEAWTQSHKINMFRSKFDQIQVISKYDPDRDV